MACRAGARGALRAQRGRRDALLHGRGLPLAQGRRTWRASPHMIARGARARARDLRDARHADAARRRASSRRAGLDYYNHNLDTSAEFYGADHHHAHATRSGSTPSPAVRDAGLKVCCGGIVGMGESASDRASCCARSPTCPSIPRACRSTSLVKVAGHPAADAPEVDPFDFVRTIAVARVLMPRAQRAACRRAARAMSDELQALCFLAGANSIFYGEKLLTTGNPDVERDQPLFARLKLTAQAAAADGARRGAAAGCSARQRAQWQRHETGRGRARDRPRAARGGRARCGVRVTVEAFAAPGPRSVLGRATGARCVDFSSNDYLGLARHPALAAADERMRGRTAAPAAAASHLVSGHGAEHERSRRSSPRSRAGERALLFSSGYMANLAVIGALAGRGERVLLDRLSHASLIDGARLSGAGCSRYAHADAARRRAPAREADAGAAALHRHRRGVQHGRRSRTAARSSRALARRSTALGWSSMMRMASACWARAAAARSSISRLG